MIDFKYYIIGSAGLCLFCYLSLLRASGHRYNPLIKSDFLFLTGLATFLIIAKLCFYNAGLVNIDESIFLSGGRTLGYDFRPWISVDTTTSGPVNFLPAILLLKLADDASYGELRLVYAAAFQIPVILIFFFTFRKLSNSYLARLAVVPLCLTFGFLYAHDHIQASSEHLPMFLLAIVISILIRILADDRVKSRELSLTGIICAFSFYAKLQVAPIFYFLAFFMFVVLYFVKEKRRDSIIFASIFIATNIIILLCIVLYGGFNDWLQSYIIGNLTYSAGTFSPFEVAMYFFRESVFTLMPILTSGLLMGYALWPRIKNRMGWPSVFYHVCFLTVLLGLYFLLNPGKYHFYLFADRNDLGSLLPLSIVLLIVSTTLLMRLAYHITGKDLIYNCGFLFTILITFYCILKPGRFYLHYNLLLVVPFYGWFAWISHKKPWLSGRYTTVVAGVTLALLFVVNTITASKEIHNAWVLPSYVNAEMLAYLKSSKTAGDRLGVWGWGTNYVHESKMLMGTRDLHFGFQTGFRGDAGKYYQARYLSDLKTNEPKWFLDLSAPGGLLSTEKSQLPYFPAIDRFVKRYYIKVYRSESAVLYRRRN